MYARSKTGPFEASHGSSKCCSALNLLNALCFGRLDAHHLRLAPLSSEICSCPKEAEESNLTPFPILAEEIHSGDISRFVFYLEKGTRCFVVCL